MTSNSKQRNTPLTKRHAVSVCKVLVRFSEIALAAHWLETIIAVISGTSAYASSTLEFLAVLRVVDVFECVACVHAAAGVAEAAARICRRANRILRGR